MATWKEDVVKALQNLGGIAHRSEIQEEVKRIRGDNLNSTWTQTIQRELESYSSDSDAFLKKQDLFYMAEGKGKGVWGLRDFKSDKLVFGHIDGIKVGQIFENRKELSAARVHGPTMSGIWGRENEGACSIVLSDGYEDDVDELDYIYYTGQGGQDAPGGKQVADQEFLRGNKALALSAEYKLPVRVTRGHQITNGPDHGYRYDGLYFVKDFERVKGKSGFYICRFHLISEDNIEHLENEIKNTLKPEYKRAERTILTSSRLKRNISLSETVKNLYEFKCQICDVHLQTPKGAIAIGAHIKGLGSPHHGPDVLENMLCLCPNHHEQFDKFGYYIDPETFEVKQLKGFEGKKIKIVTKHEIDKSFLIYHMQNFRSRNTA
jgi:putative restriction endonuclease